MGQKVGHAPCIGAGRPPGSKNKHPKGTKYQAAEEIRESLTGLVGEHKEDILARLYKQLMSLEGYAYISGLSVVLKHIMPTLQSITLEDKSDGEKSALIQRIEQLKIITSKG